jgi:hypothetical protein
MGDVRVHLATPDVDLDTLADPSERRGMDVVAGGAQVKNDPAPVPAADTGPVN